MPWSLHRYQNSSAFLPWLFSEAWSRWPSLARQCLSHPQMQPRAQILSARWALQNNLRSFPIHARGKPLSLLPFCLLGVHSTPRRSPIQGDSYFPIPNGKTNTRMLYIALKIKNTLSALKDRHQLVLNLINLATLKILFPALGLLKEISCERTFKKKKAYCKTYAVTFASAKFKPYLQRSGGGGRRSTHSTGHAP